MQKAPYPWSTPIHILPRAGRAWLALAPALAACGGDPGGETKADASASVEAGAPAEDIDGDGTPDVRSTVIQASDDARRALCSNEYETAQLSYDKITRGSWQFNPGGSFVMLPEPGYPCRAFLHDAMRPTPFDERWTNAKDADFVGFSETSTISETGYMAAQFRYFRTLIFVPQGAKLTSLTVKASGIDDALFLSVYNADHPDGTSPLDAGPSDPDVGACQGNGHGMWDISKVIAPGQINMLLLVHADMSPATSALAAVEVLANDEPIQMVSCDS